MAGNAGRAGGFPLAVDEKGSAVRQCRALLEAVGDGLYQLDTEGRIVAADEDLATLTGYDREDLLGLSAGELLASDGSTVESTVRAMLENDLETATLEVGLERADGATVPVRARVSPLVSDGEFRGTVGLVRDVSEERAVASDGRLGGRDSFGRELEEVFERVDDAFYALDDRLRFTYVNERAEELLEASEEELLGEHVLDRYPEAVETEAWDALREALATQEPTSFETYFEPLSFWVEANVYPSESGLSVYFRDVTDQKERERALEESEGRYRALAEYFPNGIVTLFDEDGRYTLAAGRGFETLPVGPEDLEGERFDEVWDEANAEALEPLFRAALAGEEGSVELTYAGREWVIHAAPVTDERGEVFAGMTMAQDITDRASLRAELERHNETLQRLYEISAASERPFEDRVREVIELGREYLDADVGFLASVDTDDDRFEIIHSTGDDERFEPGSVAPLSETYCRRTLESDGLLGVEDAPAEGWEGDPAYDRWELDCYLGGKVYVGEELFGTLCFVERAVRSSSYTDAERRFVELATQWVSYELERRERERDLQRRQRQQAVVANLGQLGLEADDLEELMAEATRLLAETLGTDFSGLLELDDEADELVVRQVAGADEDLVGRRVGTDADSQSGYTLGAVEPVVVEDLEAETRFDPPRLLTDAGVRSGVSTVVGSVEEPWGVLTVHDTDRREFTDDDVNFVQSVANVLATAIDRVDRERQLEGQRERLEALNSLHEVIHGITEAVIERSTREEIEQAVCEHLAASDSYRFAWIGDVDTRSQLLTPRASAGTDGYLDDIEISVDPEDPRSEGPAGRALLTHEVQTCQHVRTDPQFEPWREQAETYGFRSSASIPIVHEDSVFGVLNVYAERPAAFADEEREIIEQLGEVVGHAIAAVERKRALMSDEVLEVEFRVTDVFEPDGVPETDGRIEFDRVVPVGDSYLTYGRATADARESLETLGEALPHWESVTVMGEEGPARFEVRESESKLVGGVADHGGVVASAVVEDGDLNATVHLPQGADVRDVLDVVAERYSNVDLLARRQVERSGEAARETTLALTEELTDRQQTALETAYYAGFFEWPRHSSGEELAEQLDIAPATFTQHLRTAERKLLEALFEELPTGE